jgi:hypothetical protein
MVDSLEYTLDLFGVPTEYEQAAMAMVNAALLLKYPHIYPHYRRKNCWVDL